MNVFITGGNSGLGKALAEHYLQHGHRVATCSRTPSENHSNQSQHFCIDVKNIDSLKEAMMEFSNGELDLVIASAGIDIRKKTKIPNFDVARENITTNLIGVINTFDAALSQMLSQKKGQLLAISSVAGMVGLPGTGAYCASKSAINTLCESYSIDLKSYGITVTCILPGFIDTPMTASNTYPMPFLLSAEKAAKLIYRAQQKKKTIYIFPWPLKYIMLCLQKMPRFLYRFVISLKNNAID